MARLIERSLEKGLRDMVRANITARYLAKKQQGRQVCAKGCGGLIATTSMVNPQASEYCSCPWRGQRRLGIRIVYDVKIPFVKETRCLGKR